MVRIACKCDTCKVNAAKVGAPFPLGALITERMAETLKYRDGYTGKRAHGLVWNAHSPSGASAVIRHNTGLTAVSA